MGKLQHRGWRITRTNRKLLNAGESPRLTVVLHAARHARVAAIFLMVYRQVSSENRTPGSASHLVVGLEYAIRGISSPLILSGVCLHRCRLTGSVHRYFEEMLAAGWQA